MQWLKPVLFLITALLLASCQLNEPSLPDWDTSVKVHFRPDRVYMNEVLSENSLKDSLVAGLNDTLIFLSIEDETDRQEIRNEDLAFDSDDEHKEEEIGIIHLDSPGIQTTDDITLTDMFPALTIFAGETLPPIPAQVINPPGNTVHFNSFINVVVDNGELSLVSHNDLILDIGSGATISVYDSVSGSLIADVVFPESIKAGEMSPSAPVELNNQSFSNIFRLEYTIPIEETPDPILLTEDAVNIGFRVDVNVSQIDVSAAKAKVPEQNFLRQGTYYLNPDNKSIKQAVIEDGTIMLNIQNNLNVATTLDITILSATKNNVPKMVNVFLEALQNKLVDINLNGYTIKNHLNANAFVDSIYYEVSAKTDSSDGYVQIESSDNLAFDMMMDSIYVSYMEGSLSNVEIEIDPVEESDLIGLEDIDGHFKLPSVVLTLYFYNEIGFDINVDLDITAFHEDKDTGVIDSLTMHVGEILAAGLTQNPKLTTLVYDSTGGYPNIVDLMELLPTSFKISGKGRVNGEGSVSKNDAVWAKYSLESPLQITVDEPIFFTTDIDSIPEDDLDGDTRRRISEDLTDVYLVLNSYNGLPLGTELKFVISTDSTDLLNQTEIASKNIIFTTKTGPGDTDANGLVISPTESSDELRLTSPQLKIFESGPLYYKAHVRVEKSDGSVMFRKNDFYSYDGLLDVQLRVTTDEN